MKYSDQQRVQRIYDNADMEQREHKVANYSFRPEQNLSMVAEELAPYGKNNSWR